MAKAAIIVLADIETHGDLGRIANALTSAREFEEAGDETTVVFDGGPAPGGYPSSQIPTTSCTRPSSR